MHSKTYRLFEALILFVLLPVSLVFPYDFRVKIGIIGIAFCYLLYLLLAKMGVKLRIKEPLDWSAFFKSIAIRFVVIAVITTLYVYVMDSAALFCVPRSDLKLWGLILFIYTFLSVWPQEVIYRTFFFNRYADFFSNPNLLIVFNALVFMLAHLFFRNMLVLVLTAIGGLLFAYTYHKTRSTTLVSIEHAVYGNWLFTVGMGQMLAFPGMDACL